MDLKTKFGQCALSPSHKHCFSSTNTPHLGPPNKQIRSLLPGEHHQQNNLTNLETYQPEENKTGCLLVKIILINTSKTMN